MGKKTKLINSLDSLYKKGDYGNVVIQAEELLDHEKNREVRRTLYKAIGLSYLKMGDGVLALDYLAKAYPADPKTKLYALILEEYTMRGELEHEQLLKLAPLLRELLEAFSGNEDALGFLLYIAERLNRPIEVLYHLTETKKWGMILSYCRSLVLWDEIAPIEELFITELRLGTLQHYDFSVCWQSVFLPSLSMDDSYKLIRRSILLTLDHLKMLEVSPLVEGFERKQARPRGAKLKIGYLSADFFAHATMVLLARVLELHNSDEFDIHFFIVNKKLDNDFYSERIKKMPATKHFVHALDDKNLAEFIKSQNIDILVDLKGYTRDTRTLMSVYRPAPIIVSWLGFPGTLGFEPLADYIITDKIVSPPEHAPYYSETFAYMPHCYQPNDNSLVVDLKKTRLDVGLPEDAMVFCNFNGIRKFHPLQLDYYCKLLANVPNSVLWMLELSSFVTENLLKEVEKRNIDSSRIIFAPSVPIVEHRNRLALADIGLDAFPCTSHTTASDLMWACVPLIAQLGNCFWSRVSASVVAANNAPQLIASNIEEAYNLAYNLATNKELLAAVKAQLRENLKTAPLYDSELFTRNLESLYNKMWEQYEAGKKEIIELT